MSTINPETYRDEDQEIHGNMVKLFEIYIADKYSQEFWNEFRSQEDIDELYTKYFVKYGDAIFSNIVDSLAEKKDMRIKDVLSEFNSFIIKYY